MKKETTAMNLDRIYTPGKLGRLELKNRWVMLAIHTGYADEDGSFSQRDMAFYKERAKGGAAAITLVGGVNEIGCQDRMHRLDDDRYNQGIKEVCRMIHQGDGKSNCKVFMQLFHAGRNNTAQCHNGALPLCPSKVPSPIYRTEPKEMTEADIEETIEAFAEAAKRCKICGVDGVEVSISAGYLLSQFLSPLVNLRNDRWGGDEKRRMAFPTAVLTAIRQAVGEDYTVIAKISGGDMLGGYDVPYMIDFINQLPKGALDGVTVTGGWHEAPTPQISYHVAPGGFAYLAEEIKKGTGLPVIACNRINSGEAAAELLGRGIIDFVGAARPFLTDPAFAQKVRQGIPYNKCQGCNRGCIERVLKYKDVQCAFNPQTGREYLGVTAKRFEKVLVVGAGPVGLTAAKLLLEAGSQVIIVTEEKEIGGKLAIAAAPPGKQDMMAFRQYLAYEIEKAGGKVMTETAFSEELIKEEQPEHIYFAVGAEPRIFEIQGMKESGMVTACAEDVLRAGSVPEGIRSVVIVGGGTVGLETAEFLAVQEGAGLQITVLEMAEKAGKDLGGLKWIMMKSLKKLGVQVKTSAKVVRAEKGCLVVSEGEAESRYLCDMAIFAVGSAPRGDLGLKEKLEARGIGVTVLGDGARPSNIMEGLRTAYEAISGK